MDIKEKITALVGEAKIYQSQGLLNEATELYYQIKDILNSSQIKGKEKLLEDVTKKIQMLGNRAAKFEASASQPEISSKAQELIKKLFTRSESSDSEQVALEEAIIIAKFGQFDQAIEDFTNLLGNEKVKLEAAKNILKCYIEIEAVSKATDRFHQWQQEDLFNADQLKKLRSFFENLVHKRGGATGVEEPAEETEAEEAAVSEEESLLDEDDMIDISSVGIIVESGPAKGKQIELDVSFQSGNMISLILSSKDKQLIESFSVGQKLNELHFYSPIAIFKSSGVVSAKTKISSGPKQGDYCLDIEIKSL
ncbi:tetratricopeptide repeat protein [Desulforegula conservatrix]|uniref:hypothetical protein n=1 Tax=Desulforegula conservatrix TaxID=153026 RepID=UPI00040A83A8|nr:hypothetical protein [Desulforegula conservatrix]